jgi:Family of unknown function (DUF6603)
LSVLSFLGDVVAAFGKSFQPLEDSLASGTSFSAFLAEFGWYMDPGADINVIQAALGELPGQLASIPQTIAALETADAGGELGTLATALEDLESLVKATVDTVHGLAEVTPDTSWPAPLDSADFWTTFPLDLLEYLIYSYLEQNAPRVFAALRAAGVLSDDLHVPTGGGRVAYTRRGVPWDRLISAVSQPQDLPADVYGWGGKFDHDRLLTSIGTLALAFGPLAGRREVPQSILDAYYDQSAADRDAIYEMTIPLYYALIDDGTSLGMAAIELAALPIPPEGVTSGTAVGIALYPRITGTTDTKFGLSPTDTGLTVEVKGGFQSEGSVRAELRPGTADVFVDTTSLGSSDVDASLTLDGQPTQPWILLGRADGTHLEIAHAHLALRAKGTAPDVEFIAELAADSGAVVVDFGDGDGFLQKILGGAPQRAEFGVGLTWSSKNGLLFSGQATFETTIPVGQSIAGLITIDSIYVALSARADPSAASLIVAVTGGISIGPITGSIDRVGLSLDLSPISPGQASGNLGLADVSFGFKPPDGAGLGVEAGPIGGGGFLSFDTDAEQYAGVLELLIPEISLTAVGLITTKMPDGSSGFSMLLIISAEIPPIQLGFGFTLNRVGGLLGVNRDVDTDALQAGLKAGTLDSIQFPTDVVANAPKIISDIKSVFPVSEGTFLIGPMVGLGWGTPSLVTLDLGVILELPHPLRLIILGKLALAVPIPEDPLVLIQIEVVGILDFDQRTIAVDGTLHDSRIVTFPITGDMALRASYGSSPDLAMSAGGFNPRYQPPANFPSLDRMAIALADGSNPRLRLEAYFALTSNSVQAGARLDLFVDKDFGGVVGDFTVSGELGFDALVKLDPFQVVVDLYAQLEVQRNGSDFASIAISMTISGPRPWHAWGQGTVHVCWSDHSIPFDVTIGPDQPAPPLPPANPGPDLLKALQNPGNWSAKQPSGSNAMVALVDATAGAASGSGTASGSGANTSGDTPPIVLHPAGQVTVRQRVVPLDVQIATYGHQPLASPTTYSVQCTNSTIKATGVQDLFSPGDFFALSDDQKLSQPGFESFDSGLALTSSALESAGGVNATYRYVTKVVDYASPDRSTTCLGKTLVAPAVADALSHRSAAASVASRTQGENRFAAPGTPVTLTEPTYALTSRSTLKAISGAGDTGTYTHVAAERAARADTDPVHAGDLQIVDAAEVLV